MQTKITVVYDNPEDVQAFERGFPAHLELARCLPGVCAVESAKVWPKEDGSATPFHRILDLTFMDYAAASAAVTTPEAENWIANVFELSAGGARIAFAAVEERTDREVLPVSVDRA